MLEAEEHRIVDNGGAFYGTCDMRCGVGEIEQTDLSNGQVAVTGLYGELLPDISCVLARQQAPAKICTEDTAGQIRAKAFSVVIVFLRGPLCDAQLRCGNLGSILHPDYKQLGKFDDVYCGRVAHGQWTELFSCCCYACRDLPGCNCVP